MPTINHNALPSVSNQRLNSYVDASVLPTTGEAYFGVVVLSSDGTFFAAKNGSLNCMNDPHLAEALAIKEALFWFIERGWGTFNSSL